MTQKILAVHSPKLTAYCYYGFLTSILQGAEDFEKWLYGNFISFRIARSKVISYDNPMSPTFLTPWTKAPCYDRDIINLKWDNIIDFITDALDRNHFLFLKVNRKYLRAFSGYQKRDSPHELFVYGYDREKGILYLADNFHYGKFVFATASFEELTEAYNKTGRDSYGGVFLVSVNFEKSFEVDLTQLKDRLDDFLRPQKKIFTYNPLPIGTLAYDLRNDPCGTEAYQYILNDLNERLVSEEISRLDHRIFYLFWEHKSLMVSRLLYLKRENLIPLEEDLIEQIKKAEELFRIMLNLCLKYNVQPRKPLLRRIKEYMQEGITLESEALNRLLLLI